MDRALRVWRLFPTQIESDLRIHCHGLRIADWHSGRLSSRELLVLLNGLPEDSEFKKASERTYRIVKYCGDNPELKGKYLRLKAIGAPPKDCELLVEYLDWTFDQKLQARTVRELAALRPEPDFTGVTEPEQIILANLRAQEMQRLDDSFDAHLMAGLHGAKGGEST